MKVYINSVFVGEKAHSGALNTYDCAILLGRRDAGNQAYLDGLIDELSIYNYALSADEITDLYQQFHQDP